MEHDYDGEFRYTERPLAAVQGIDPHQRVIYIGTFTKALFPALRLDYAVVAQKTRFFCFFSEGHFGAHIRRMREIYRERRDALVAAAGRHLAELDLRSTDAGLHAVANLNSRASDRAGSGRIARAGLTLSPLLRFYLGPPRISRIVSGLRRVVAG